MGRSMLENEKIKNQNIEQERARAQFQYQKVEQLRKDLKQQIEKKKNREANEKI